MNKYHVAVLEFPDEYCALEKYCSAQGLQISDFTIVACEPVLQAFLREKQVPFENTLLYFPPSCHDEIIYSVEPLMESIRSLFRFEDKYGITTSYSNEVALHLRFYANHLFKMAWIISAICKRYQPLHLYGFVSPAPSKSVTIDEQDRFLGEIAELFCHQQNIPFVALTRSKTKPSQQNVMFDMGNWLRDFFSDVLSRFFLSIVRTKCLIFSPPVGKSFSKIEKILKPLNPAYVVLTTKSYTVFHLLWNIAAVVRLIAHWGPVRFFIPVPNRCSSDSDGWGKPNISRSLDQAINSIPNSRFMVAGISIKTLLIKKARAGLFPHMQNLVSQAEKIFEYLALCDHPLLISHMGVDVYGVSAELFALKKIPCVFVSHGAHPVPSSPSYEIELLNLCRGFMLGVFPVVALANPVQESHLDYFKGKYGFVRSAGLRTGPLIFSNLQGCNKKKARHALGLSEDEFVIVHASTMKNRSGERFGFIETFDEFFVTAHDILEASRLMDRARYILRLHPGFTLNDDEIRTLLGHPRQLIIHRKGSFSEVLACADIVVSYSSTVIDEALLNNIPVLLYDKWSRYNHFNTAEFNENPRVGGTKFFPVCYVNNPNLLTSALKYLRDVRRGGGESGDVAFEPYKYSKDYSANMFNFVRSALEIKEKTKKTDEFSKVKGIIFDCDGVLVDSVSQKTKAFREWVKTHYPQFEKEFMNYHLASYGVGRAEQLNHFVNEILSEKVNDDAFKSMLLSLTKCIGEHMKAVKLSAGAGELISGLTQKKIMMFVVSGAPQGELNFHLARLGVYKNFQGVYGNLISKEDAVKAILKSHKMTPDDLIFVGDATADAEVAFRFGIRFAYYPSQAKMESNHIWKKLDVLRELASYV